MIYYLVQGEAYQYLDRMAEMANSGAEVIFLTWDKPVDGALFLPNSTWAQGRNFLLQHVLKNNYTFEYLVFIDGDAKPVKGSWKEFNAFLLTRKPQVCIPLMPIANYSLLYRLIKWLHIPFALPLQQRAIIIDEQVQAFRKDVIDEIGIYIYPTLFDNSCWWYNSEISQQILRCLFPHNILQFNALVIDNNSHLSYPQSYDFKFIHSYLKKFGLYSLFSFIHFKNDASFYTRKSIKLLSIFVELLYLLPFSIKEFDIAKRAEYVKQCLQKMEQPTEETTKNQQSCKSI